jgi:hypothetical protein
MTEKKAAVYQRGHWLVSNISDVRIIWNITTTPAASPHASQGPQKHVMVFRSKHIYFEHKSIKNY